MERKKTSEETREVYIQGDPDGVEGYVVLENGAVLENLSFTGARSARAMHPDGRPYHTFRTATLRVSADGCVLRNCRISNTAGPGKTAGQALALYLDGDDILLEDCILTGSQDTLFMAPLPPTVVEKDGFLGPGENTPRIPRSIRLHRCVIEGGVDFVFGGANCLFTECEFRSVEPGYVFAPCTPAGERGFVARDCRFSAADNVPEGSVYLARPWREYAAVRLENCWMDRHICREGFADWAERASLGGVRFSEFSSTGPGACPGGRPAWVVQG